jgi:hypothetical protein
VVPPISHTYVNNMFPKSYHFVVIFPKGNFIQSESVSVQLIS